MKGKETGFFAIDNDLYSVLEEVENSFSIEYVKMGSFEADESIRYSSFSSIPNFGLTDNGDWAGSDHHYMLIPSKSDLNIREVGQEGGGLRFLIDPMKNPASVELTTNGIYTKKENVIVAGRVATVSEDPFSVAIYKSLSSKIKKKFKRIGGFYVGPKAEEKLIKGWRLVQIEKAPKEYDLASS